MLVATFVPASGWDGRQIYWDDGRYVLYGHGAIRAADVLEYDRLGHLEWASPDLRGWVGSVAQWEAGVSAPGAAPAGSPAAGAAPRTGFPAWAVILIACGVAVVVLGVLLAVLIPAFVLRAGESISDQAALRAGVRNIKMGIEAFSADHNGAYPDPALVSGSHLGAYIGSWPVNPYTDLPMARGAGAGNFGYEVSADGLSYRLVGYGDDGKVVIELRGGGAITY